MEQRRLEADNGEHRLEAILEQALRAYYRDERHGGADWVGERALDAELVPIARIAYLDADDMPGDAEVGQMLDGPLQLLGEGYHVMALVDASHRVVVKYVKHGKGVPPLASAQPAQEDWSHDHAVRADGTLHPAIWQHIRSFEEYGDLAVTSRVYIADGALERLAAHERQSLEPFQAIGIVRSLGRESRVLHVRYPDGFPDQKRALDGVTVSVLVLQPVVTPLAAAIEQALRHGDVAAARDLEARYDEFTRQLWRCGVSHLDFSILNIGVVGAGSTRRLQIFDPHMGVIEVAEGSEEVRDPFAEPPADTPSIGNVLRSARDGSRWALWRVQEELAASSDVPPEGTEGAAAVVRDFHVASEGVERGEGSFGVARFDRTWRQRPNHGVNSVMHAQLWRLLGHPLGRLVRSALAPVAPDAIYDRAVMVVGMEDHSPLPQFRAVLNVYQAHPLIVLANVSEEAPRLVKHWARVLMPGELDIQDDPAIHYHLRDLFTGETYVRAGDDLTRRGFVVGLTPFALHVLQVEDIVVDDLVLERALAVHRDMSRFLPDCTKRLGVIGDVHGELQSFKGILRTLGFIDASDRWLARDGTLVLTGDVGHGPGLQEVFDFIRNLAAQAHALSGRIVWTLGNHDLYLDREGGQGGEQSLGYRLWPTIRDAALHPERHPGLVVQATYFQQDKLFAHGGILPHIVALSLRDRGADDAEAVASYVNDVLRGTLVERERIAAADMPHEIFTIGTSHTRHAHMPGEPGYEPAGIFTPDLREVDHYRYHARLLPQVVGHTASPAGKIRYAPGSWLRRDYIAVDVGRQHGSGNAGLLLTDFGWVAVTEAGAARLVEVAPLFVKLAHETTGDGVGGDDGDERLKQLPPDYFRVAKSHRGPLGEDPEALLARLSPGEVVRLERYLGGIRQMGRAVICMDMDDTLTAFSGSAVADGTIPVLADFLAAGGILVFGSDSAFDWFYVRLLRPLVVELGPRSSLLQNVLLVLSGGAEVFVFEEGACRLLPRRTGPERGGTLDALMALVAEGRVAGVPDLDPQCVAVLRDCFARDRMIGPMAERIGMVMNVAEAMLEAPDQPINELHRGYRRAIEVVAAATAALRDSGHATLPESLPEVGDTALWTFEHQAVPPGSRVRVRGRGFVHAGVARPDGGWNPVYNVPLVPLPQGDCEAVLPRNVTAFTFFWTESPWTGGRPGHWEAGPAFRVGPP